MDDFPKTTQEEDELATREGLFIYGHLKKKYPNENTRDLDIILNSLVAALIRMAKLNTRKEDYESFCELVQKIMRENK